MTLHLRAVARVWTVAAVLAFAGCVGSQAVFRSAGPAAGRIATLGWFVVLLFSATTVVMWIILAWVAARRRGTLATHEAWDAPDPKGWIIFGGLLVPLITLSIVFVYSSAAMGTFPMRLTGPRVSTRIIASQWWWEVHYIGAEPDAEAVTANEIHVPAGAFVDIELMSRDVIHSFWAPRLHGKVDLIPGIRNHIRIRADQPGVYRGQCAQYCGQGHSKMVFFVVSQSPQEYEKWLSWQRQPALQPASDESRQGEQTFMSHACALCHSVRGTAALGKVGPDLTHLAGRGHIAGYFVNDTANLEAWVTHAQSLKPGALMPNLTQFDGPQLRGLVAYLQALR